MEEIIAEHLDLLDIQDRFEDVKLKAKQFYLPHCGGFIDLLLMSKDNIIIVELKNEKVVDLNTITMQIEKYKDELKMTYPQYEIVTLLASTDDCSEDVKEACKEYGVIFKKIPIKKILKYINNTSSNSEIKNKKKLIARLLQRRLNFSSLQESIDSLNIPHEESKNNSNIHSIEEFIKKKSHDNCSRAQLGKIFIEISKKAPIMAHEIFTESSGRLQTEEDKWFWIFYSVLDRRANASTFVKAKRVLEKFQLFKARDIFDYITKKSRELTIKRIHNILKASDFHLVSDSTRLEMAMPNSIVSAAEYLSTYNFKVDNILGFHKKKHPDMSNIDVSVSIIKNLKRNIYGVGPRISAQILRGLVLKGGWNLPLAHVDQLERCSFNEYFAGDGRLGLISNTESFNEDLKEFTNEYLNENFGIISHVLWYIRKRFCIRPKFCDICPVSGYCLYFIRRLLVRRTYEEKSEQLELFPGFRRYL